MKSANRAPIFRAPPIALTVAVFCAAVFPPSAAIAQASSSGAKAALPKAPAAAIAQTTPSKAPGALAPAPAASPGAPDFTLPYTRSAERLRQLSDVSGTVSPTADPAAVSGPGGAAIPGPAPWDLSGLIAFMERDNASLAAKAEAINAARADLAGAKARRLPSLKTEASGAFLANPQEAITIPAGALGKFPPALGGGSLPPTETELFPAVDPFQFSLKLIGELPLVTWGKTTAGISAADAGLGAALLVREKQAYETRIRLRGYYEALAYTAEAEAILALQREVGDRVVSLAVDNERTGFITATEALSAKLKIRGIQVAQAQLAQQRERLLSQISALTGLSGAGAASGGSAGGAGAAGGGTGSASSGAGGSSGAASTTAGASSGSVGAAANANGTGSAPLSLKDLVLAAPSAERESLPLNEAQERFPAGNYDLSLAKAQIGAKQALDELAQAKARGLPDIGFRAELSYAGSRIPFAQEKWEDRNKYQLILSIGASGNPFWNPVESRSAAKARSELEQARLQLQEGERSIRAFIQESYQTLELQRIKLEYANARQQVWAAELAQKRAILNAGGGTEGEYLAMVLEALGGIAETYGTLAEYRSTLLGLELVLGR